MTDTLKSIMDLFARSPFRPLNEHAEKVRLTAMKMDEAVKAYLDGDEAKVDTLFKEISTLEHAADHVKHTIRENMPSTLLMPVDRADIINFLKQQDDIANSAEIVSQMLWIKKVNITPAVKEAVLNLESEVMITVNAHVDAVGKIVNLLDSSFSSKRVKEIQSIINEVDTHKHNVDVARVKTIKTIYENEEALGTIGVYHLVELVEELAWVAGHAENASDRIRIIVARR
ncbi:TIGR00153 family protein [Methanocella sp. CWC-04]|uniref:TIGR00153 family protein n=1 Tax=Methanooceanicella nereidis TaxID=2052831 RepID=A0AAP2RBJ3_9EURY|nr:TIGR00153 family protein [Methanocella sp. CWC-04]MCD1294484.1 TIGR00153 family protein [Methanocella sp. CWC-04]